MCAQSFLKSRVRNSCFERFQSRAFAEIAERRVLVHDQPMQIVIGDVLSAADIATVRSVLARAQFVDGKESAGFAARMVKDNRQASGGDRSLETVRKLISERILANDVFNIAVRPKALSPLLFSRYEPGMQYGSHVDDAVMAGM